jgi:hypothetical protein
MPHTRLGWLAGESPIDVVVVPVAADVVAVEKAVLSVVVVVLKSSFGTASSSWEYLLQDSVSTRLSDTNYRYPIPTVASTAKVGVSILNWRLDGAFVNVLALKLSKGSKSDRSSKQTIVTRLDV